MEEKGLSVTLVVWIGGFLLTIIGTLIIFAWGSIVYIFSRHRDDNDSEHEYYDKIILEHEQELVKLRTEHNIFRGRCQNE